MSIKIVVPFFLDFKNKMIACFYTRIAIKIAEKSIVYPKL